MRAFGLFLGILAAFGMLLAFIPLLGWLNWINIPFAIIGLIFCAIGRSNGGMVLCVTAIIFGILRLMLGGGIL